MSRHLADRFAVVEGFKDGEEAGVFLGEAGEGVEVLRALVGGEGGPFRVGRGGRLATAVATSSAVPWVTWARGLPVAGLAVVKVSPGCGEGAVDEVAEGAVVLGDPGEGLGGGFGGGAVGHAVEDFLDGHGVSPSPCAGGAVVD